MSRQCITHHHACDCRERKFAELEAENKRLTEALELLDLGSGLHGEICGVCRGQCCYENESCHLEQALKGAE